MLRMLVYQHTPNIFMQLCIILQLQIVFQRASSKAEPQNRYDTPQTFVGAVIEHIPYYVNNLASTIDGLKVKLKNLGELESSLRKAKLQGANVIVFPEYGITGYMHYNSSAKLKGRESLGPYREQIPLPDTCPSSNCSLSAFARLSCLARRYKIYITANLIEEVTCNGNNCPPDGLYQYNTNLVFNKTGCLIAKYHKFHLYELEQRILDAPILPEHVVFETEFGRFGTMICYDVLFEEPGITLVEKYHVDHIVFPTDWPNLKAFLYTNIVQVTTGWARRMNVNFLAANIHDTSSHTYGSAISASKSVLNSTYKDFDIASDILLTSDIGSAPRIQCHNTTFNLKSDYLNKHIENYGDQPVDFTMIRGLSGSARGCNGKFCCLVDFDRDDTDELFILAAVNGDVGLGFPVQACFIQKCENHSIESCEARHNSFSSTHFSYLRLSGLFESKYVLPSLMGSGYRFMGLAWCFWQNNNINVIVADKLDFPILSVSLLGVI